MNKMSFSKTWIMIKKNIGMKREILVEQLRAAGAWDQGDVVEEGYETNESVPMPINTSKN